MSQISEKKKKSLLGTHGDLRHDSRGRLSAEVKKNQESSKTKVYFPGI